MNTLGRPIRFGVEGTFPTPSLNFVYVGRHLDMDVFLQEAINPIWWALEQLPRLADEYRLVC